MNPDTSAVGEASQAFSSIIQTSYGEQSLFMSSENMKIYKNIKYSDTLRNW